MLGICYGMQLLARELGGRVEGAEIGEFGRSELTVRSTGRLLAGTPEHAEVLDVAPRHGLPRRRPGSTPSRPRRARPSRRSRATSAGIYGIQFHPEVVHTPYGQTILTTFLRDICGCDMAWSAASIVEEQIARIRAQVGTGKVICGLSGGVDSSVAAVLVHRAIGDQLTCVFVDHGLMRKNEGEQVISAFRDEFGIPLVAVDAEERFLNRLAGVTDPEAKRKAIGSEFIRVFEEEAAKIGRRELPRAGHAVLRRHRVRRRHRARRRSSRTTTSAACPTTCSSSSSSRCGCSSRTRSAPWAPSSGMPEKLVWRQPFPGPGLAIRIVGGQATKERLDLLRECDHILQDEIRKAGLYRDLWQSFCVLPDIRTVGVQGDERTYGNVVVIRAVTSDDAMTADWARLPYDLLEQIASRMINELRDVNRVTLDITSKPPGTIEWE